MAYTNEKLPINTCLIGIDTDRKTNPWPIDDSIQELKELAKTAGLSVSATLTQKLNSPHPNSYLGSGKIEELKTLLDTHHIPLVIADDELSPSQQKVLEKALEVKVLDRTGLILDIFAQRANTHEAQLQVELAQLEYQLPRLTRLWTHLSRLGGGIGTRGPGEKQLEVDKRQVRKRVSLIKKDLEKVKRHRELYRTKRQSAPILTAALIGYTNAGKSTLMNQLTQADVRVEDKLFATLDPTTRKIILPNKESLLITDTVGFIQKLPHQLVSAFQATLEEAIEADLLIHVVDCSHPKSNAMLQTAQKILEELEQSSPIHISQKPQLLVCNKIDCCDSTQPQTISSSFKETVRISALLGTNIDQLLLAIQRLFLENYSEITYRIPYSRMDIVNLLHSKSKIIKESYTDTIQITTKINTIIGQKIMGLLYRPYKT